MPYLFGAAPIRRTLQYLDSGNLVFKNRVKVMEVHYNMFWRNFDKPKYSDPHDGLREFFFWEIPHIQYKNPNVQIVRFLEMTPLPFIRCWLDDGKDVMFDCDSKDRSSILQHLTRTLGKTKAFQEMETMLKKQGAIGDEKQDNPAMFGFNRKRFCMCEVPDQVPCPGLIDLPLAMQGKYKYQKKEELEEYNDDLDRPYPTQDELCRRDQWFPVKHDPPLQHVPGLDKMYMKKPPQTTQPFRPPATIVKEWEVQKRLDELIGDKPIKYKTDDK
ncbi:putative 28S ribosomal protein S25, mitochondrial [Halotydeus destructor]|nr:putative 28S ribosomal protein S25, mitochondrial [Halotydeus destructor]